MKKVSVILTTYNGATRGYLNSAIESVLNQTFKDYELIIVDDGSTDNTKSSCSKFLTRPNVSYLYKENGGPASARNIGVKKSKGEFICFIDDDDLWNQNKLEKQVNFFRNQSDKKIGMIYTSIEFIYKNGKAKRIKFSNTNGNIYKELFLENIINATSSVMIKKNVFDKVGYFNENELIKGCEDYEMWIRIAKVFDIYSLNEVLVKYRLHDISLSSNRKKMEFALYIALYYALKNDKSIDENWVYNNYYKKITIDRLLRKNYIEFRKYYKLTFAYGRVGFYLSLMFLISFFFDFFRILIKMLKFVKNNILKSILT